MKKISIALGVATLLIVGCGDKPKEDTTKVEKAQEANSTSTTDASKSIYGASTTSAPAHIHTYAKKTPTEGDIQTNTPHIGIVLETMDATGYTYAKVDENGSIYWIAAPQVSVKVGDKISYVEQMVMKDFSSKALNKTFDYLMFASTMVKSGEASQADKTVAKSHTVEMSHQHTKQNKAEAVAEKISVAKLKGGYTVEELYASKDKLKDKAIKLRAKVVKVTKGIMGKDWIHLQDGTGKGVTSDIILTTKTSNVVVGDVVVAEAIFKTDVDLGYGYFFEVILEEGKLGLN